MRTIRPPHLDARNTFAATVPKLTMNDFGVFVGGPVTVPKLYRGKDRTFFFGSYEGLRRPNQAIVIDSVPTAAMRAGDLSVVSAENGSEGSCWLRARPSPIIRFPLPASRRFPLAVLNYFDPLPNYGAANAIANNYETSFPDAHRQQSGRLPRWIRISLPSKPLFARVTYKRRETISAPSGSVNLGGGDALENDYGFTVAHNFVITPHLINEARVGYTGVNTGTNYAYTAAGIQQALGLQLAGPPPPGAASPSFLDHRLYRHHRRHYLDFQNQHPPGAGQPDLDARAPYGEIRRRLPASDGALHQRFRQQPHGVLFLQ